MLFLVFFSYQHDFMADAALHRATSEQRARTPRGGMEYSQPLHLALFGEHQKLLDIY